MPTLKETIEAVVTLLSANEVRSDDWMNGDETTDYTTTGGVVVPSVRKFLAETYRWQGDYSAGGTEYVQGQTFKNGYICYRVLTSFTSTDFASDSANFETWLDLSDVVTDAEAAATAAEAAATAAEGFKDGAEAASTAALTATDNVSLLDNDGVYTVESEVADLRKKLAAIEVISPMLDTMPVAAFAFSLLPLKTGQGRVLRVRRDSDDAELDFTAPEISDGTMLDWVGAGNSGFAVRLYSVAGDSNYLFNSTPAEQRKIVDVGVLVTEGGRPALDGSAYGYAFNSNILLPFDFSVLLLSNITSVQSILGSTTNNPRIRINGTSQVEVVGNSGGEVNFTRLDNAPTYMTMSGQRNIMMITRTNGEVMTRIAGQDSAVGSQTMSENVTFSRAFSRAGVDILNSKTQALIVWDRDVSAYAADARLARRFSEPSRVTLFAGQSNTQGRALDGTTLTVRTDDATIYEYYNGAGTQRQTFADLYPNGGTIVGFGPNVGAMRTLRADGEADIYAIRYGVGGQCLPSFIPEVRRLVTPKTSLPGSNTDISASMISYFNNALNDMTLRYFRYADNVNFVWYQGAEDSKYDGNQGAYPQDLSGQYVTALPTLLSYVKSNVAALNLDSPVVIIKSPDWNANSPGTKPYQDVVRAAQTTVATADETAALLDSDAPGGVTATWEDVSHIDAATQERLGIDLATLLT